MHKNVEGERSVSEEMEATEVRVGAQGAVPASGTGFHAPRAGPPGRGEVDAPVPAAGASELPIARGGAKGDRVHFEAECYEEEDLGDEGSGAKSGGGESSAPGICHIVKGRCRDLRFLGVRARERS